MRILTRYILREVTSHALLGGVLFTFVLFMRDLGRILELIVRDSASPADAARLFLYTLPNALTVTIPMAVLVGILLGLSRLAADSEITAMRASGMGALDFVRIVSSSRRRRSLLGLVNSLYLAPRAATALLALDDSAQDPPRPPSKSSLASSTKTFKNYVLYVQDVRPAAGAALWRHVFLADLSTPAAPTSSPPIRPSWSAAPQPPATRKLIRLHLLNGSQHQTSTTRSQPIQPLHLHLDRPPHRDRPQEDTHVARSRHPDPGPAAPRVLRQGAQATPLSATSAAIYRIEFNRRLSYPFACLVLMLVGVPLGLSSKRGGKSTGFVLTILLVFVYYFLSSIGVAFAKTGKLSPFLGVWGANLIFAAAGAFLLYQLSRGGIALSIFASAADWLKRTSARLLPGQDPDPERNSNFSVATVLRRVRSAFGLRFPLILDDYVLREFSTNLALVLTTFAMLFLVFTFFELIGDIIRNRTPLVTVGDYLLNLIPYILYNTTPLCALVAVLITFGGLNRSSELTAMKATGISLYRVVIPILVLCAAIAAGLFAFDDFYLPAANRRQESLRATIKGKPAQTFLRPDRKWISGQVASPNNTSAQPDSQNVTSGNRPNHIADPARIFYYQFFEKNVFANLTIFEFAPDTFTLQRRIFAASAHWDDHAQQWVFENGWQRTFSGDATASFQPFTLSSFPEIREQPSYFKKEDRPSQEMSYGELSRYINDLSQSGFDTMRLRVQLNEKIAKPVITLVMAVLAIPFALSMGKRGGLAGIATAIGLAIAYWVVAGLFEAMGNVNTLPAMLAAWSPDLLFGLTGAYLLLRTPT